jgi:hypothetical protein
MPLTMAAACSCRYLAIFSQMMKKIQKARNISLDAYLGFIYGNQIPWAPASSALFIIHCSPAGILRAGEAAAAAIAPTARYISLSAIIPCSQSTNTHYSDICQFGLIELMEILNAHTSEPRPAIVRAKLYPGNSIHCPTQGAPPSRARSKAARKRVLPVSETIAEVNPAVILRTGFIGC